MISIDINETKKLRFKVSLSGVQVQDLKGSMRIMVDNIEYGFPISIDKGDIIVEVSPISKIHSKKIKDGSLLDAKLEVIAGDNYLVPWQDKIKVNNPIKVEATVEEVMEEINNIIPKVKVSDVSEEHIEKKENIIKEEKKEDKKKKIKSRFSEIFEEKKCPEGEKW